ncbi:response regulator [Magnetospirillum sp. SS-4]|uniref:response regulator n=1 Tax=Magnetospirillum sp. SS-4 TaxID=2681465 RepID=UPI0013827A6C|nr:response regulator [Magnetospirillum sp. SS-4]CAA7616979.1 hypothetical protein MTBSS4_180012 [Magnetospirillum sp. SS-4]
MPGLSNNLLKGARLMLIGERQLARELLVSSLKQAGAGTTIHGPAHEMLQRLAEFKPQMIFCEYDMEPLNGCSCVQHMRKHKVETPVVMLVHKGDAAAVTRSKAAGADQVIQIPFTVADVLATVRRIVSPDPTPKRRELYFGD